MNVLMINGSPHEKGCTDTALRVMADVLHEEGIDTECFWVGTRPMGGCIACRKCRDLGKCVFDDGVNTVLSKAAGADGFVFGSPVHYAALSGQMKAFMDRLFYAEALGRGNRDFYLKPACAVISARRGGTTAAFDEMNKYFTIQQMPVVSSRYWNQVHGTVPEEVLQDVEGIATIRILARNMAYMLKAFDLAKKAGLPLPKQEAVTFLNFIH